MNLYFKDGNATAEAELSTLGLADGSVTLGQLAPVTVSKLGLNYNPATAEGSLLALPAGESSPPGYGLYKRSDRNGSLEWEEKAPVSIGRYTGDGLVELDGKIYFVGGYNSSGPVRTFERFDPITNQWDSMPYLQDAVKVWHQLFWMVRFTLLEELVSHRWKFLIRRPINGVMERIFQKKLIGHVQFHWMERLF